MEDKAKQEGLFEGDLNPTDPLGLSDAGSDPSADVLVLQVRMGDMLLSDAAVGYPNRGSLLLSLSELVQMLRFAIDVNPITGAADGWYITENRRFSFDAERLEATSDGKSYKLKEGYYLKTQDGLFIDIRSLSEWFPVDIKFSLAAQEVEIKPREKLPLQDEEERGKERDKILGAPTAAAVRYPHVANPYTLGKAGWADVNSEVRFDSTADTPFATTTDITGGGDFLNMTGQYFVSANDAEGVGDIRLKLGRTDPDGGLLGGLKATEFAMGDIYTPQIPLISSSVQGRGVSVSNFPLERVSEFNQVTLRGDVLPGWEVELYRNDVLLNVTKVGPDGRYEFIDVPLVTGLNIVRLAFYGPFGERREEIKRFFIGPEIVKQGETFYGVAVNQQSTDLLQINEDFIRPELAGKTRMITEFQHGLSNSSSLLGSVSSLPLEDGKEHQYLSLGYATSLPLGIYSQSRVSQDSHGGTALGFDFQSRVGDFNTTLQSDFFQGYISEDTLSIADPLTQRTVLGFDGAVNVPWLESVNSGLTLSREEFESSRTEDEVSLRNSLFFGRSTVSNTLGYQLNTAPAGDTSELFEGDVLYSANLQDIELRGGLAYGFHPVTELQNVSLTGDYFGWEEMALRLGISKELTGDGLATYSAGLSKDFKKYILNLNTTVDDEGSVLVGVSASLSLGKNPRTNRMATSSVQSSESGILSARVFVDKNNNNQFDAGDVPAKGVLLRVDGGSVAERTGEDGVVFMNTLPTFRPIAITIDSSTLEDPYLMSAEPGKEIVLRPGLPVTMDFALITTGEIDGTVFLNKNGEIDDTSNVQLQLISTSGKIIAETRSQYDGYYVFDQVPPGAYRVRVDPEQLKRLGLTAPKDKIVSIGSGTTVVNGLDIILSLDIPLAAPAAEVAQPAITLPAVTMPAVPVAPVLSGPANAEMIEDAITKMDKAEEEAQRNAPQKPVIMPALPEAEMITVPPVVPPGQSAPVEPALEPLPTEQTPATVSAKPVAPSVVPESVVPEPASEPEPAMPPTVQEQETKLKLDAPRQAWEVDEAPKAVEPLPQAPSAPAEWQKLQKAYEQDEAPSPEERTFRDEDEVQKPIDRALQDETAPVQQPDYEADERCGGEDACKPQMLDY